MIFIQDLFNAFFGERTNEVMDVDYQDITPEKPKIQETYEEWVDPGCNKENNDKNEKD